MSRVIKSALWQEEPKIVERPAILFKKNEQETVEAVSVEAQMILLQEKEEQAKKMLADAESLRNAIFAEAQQEAAAIKADALAEAEKIKAEAREQGQAEGFEEGRQTALKQVEEEQRETLDEANAKAERTMNAAREEMKNCMVLAEREIVEMVMGIVEKVLPQHFIDAPQIILPLVRKALEKVSDQSGIIIRVSPDNYEFVLMARNEFQAMLSGNDPLQVQADASLGRGDCVVESLNGSVDARLATQMELIKKSIQEVME